ncbi:MAG: peptidoglycan bridge formation glycyltransferase FemA/FemB family protein [Sphingobacteriales bacterium]|nr:MAG: peptidoglycan bridge formation glycyltransferase FemA/FemB family protein [Sphingobacteriales bacterium]
MKWTIVHGIESVDIKEWEQFTSMHHNGNFFQTPQFYQYIKKVDGYKPVIIAALDDKNEIAGILTGVLQKDTGYVKGIFSSRLIVWGAPLVKNDDKSVIDQLLKELVKKYQHKSIFIEFRNLFSIAEERNVFEKNGFEYKEHLNFIVDTRDEKTLLSAMNDGKKRQIKKSLNNGAVILENVTEQQVKVFYGILLDLYNTKVRKPLPAWSFFKEFYDSPHLGKYFLIAYKDEIVGGIMCPVFGNKTIYEWYIAGKDGVDKNIYPSVLATWAPMAYALKNGISSFDFLGAGKPEEDYGVRQFKAGFGGEQVAYGRYLRINNPLLYKIGKSGLAFLKRMKRVSVKQ